MKKKNIPLKSPKKLSSNPIQPEKLKKIASPEAKMNKENNYHHNKQENKVNGSYQSYNKKLQHLSDSSRYILLHQDSLNDITNDYLLKDDDDNNDSSKIYKFNKGIDPI